MAHVIEPAKSGRASCRTCREPIAKGELRLGEEVPNTFSDSGEATHVWHHLACAAVGVIDEELDGHVHPAVVGRQSRVGGEVGRARHLGASYRRRCVAANKAGKDAADQDAAGENTADAVGRMERCMLKHGALPWVRRASRM